MKTPTLLVRLLGLYLVYKTVSVFYLFWQFERTVALAPQKPVATYLNNALGIAIIGFILGLALTAKAGRIASLLTSDSE